MAVVRLSVCEGCSSIKRTRRRGLWGARHRLAGSGVVGAAVRCTLWVVVLVGVVFPGARAFQPAGLSMSATTAPPRTRGRTTTVKASKPSVLPKVMATGAPAVTVTRRRTRKVTSAEEGAEAVKGVAAVTAAAASSASSSGGPRRRGRPPTKKSQLLFQDLQPEVDEEEVVSVSGEEEEMELSSPMHLPAEEQLGLAREVKTLARWKAVRAAEELRLGRKLSMPEWAALLRVTEERLYRQLRQSMEARAMLITTNIRLVSNMARSYYSAGITSDGNSGNRLTLLDLVNEGTLGVVRAAEKFDPERGIRFTTYATWWIRHCMSLAVSQSSNVVRLPLNMHTRIRRVKAARTQLYLDLGREPTSRELASACGMEIDKVNALRRAAKSRTYFSDGGEEAASSLFFNSQSGKSQDVDGSINPRVSDQERRLEEEVESLLGQFPEGEQQILRLRWGLHDGELASGGGKKGKKDKLTIGEIAKHCRSSYDKIRKLETRALDLVKERHGLLHSLFQASSPMDSSGLLVAAA